MNYFTSNYLDVEKSLITLTISILQQLGGQAEKTTLIAKLEEHDDDLAEYINTVSVSKRTGAKYKKFNFRINFAIKTLVFANILQNVKTPLTLTEKGMHINLNNFDIDSEVYALSNPKWEAQSATNRKQKNAKDHNICDDNEEDAANKNTYDEQFEQHFFEAIGNMSPQKFETFARKLLASMGVELSTEGLSYVADGGIDGFGYHLSDGFKTSRIAIQAKRWKGPVSSPEIDKFRGAMDKFQADYGVFITNSLFTKAAREAAKLGSTVITLIDGHDLIELVKKYNVYLHPVTAYELEEFYLAD